MSKTRSSIARILKVQKQKLHLAEWKIFDLQRQQATLVQNQDALKRLIDTDDTAGSNLANIAMRTEQRSHLVTTRLKQAERLATETMQREYRAVKLSERIFQREKFKNDHEKEKHMLDDVINQISQRKF
jgi:hypothetical protein